MAPRTSRAEVQAVFERLCETAGVPIGGAFDPESRTMSRGWNLNHNSAYGGWVVVGYDGNGTGEYRPLGDRRMPASEFVAAMHLAIRAVEASNPALTRERAAKWERLWHGVQSGDDRLDDILDRAGLSEDV